MSGPRPTASQLAREVHLGQRRAIDLVEQTLTAIGRVDGELRAFCGLFGERARRQALAIDQRRASGDRLGPLAGVPVALKDNLLLEGEVAACGSRMLESFVAPYTATAVQRLLAADAIPIGRTNMDEFGMGSSCERSVFGATHNPWQNGFSPGGSSGGAAAAVAAGLVPLALGSDTGGSVRQPAAFCGVLGLKPTYGRISRSGLVAYASSLDCVGALAHDPQDLLLLLAAISGQDPADGTTLAAPRPDGEMPQGGGMDLRGLRIGIPDELNGPGIDDEVLAAVSRTLRLLADRGAELVPLALPSVKHGIPTYYLIAAAEASANLARYDGVRYGLRAEGHGIDGMFRGTRSAGFGAEVQLRILLGTFALRAGWQDRWYGQATRVRALLRAEFAAAFARCDVIACPTSPVAGIRLGERLDDPLAMYLCDALTVPASLCGLPALSMPCGVTAEPRLPIGLQWIAPPLHEPRLLQLAAACQALQPFPEVPR